MITAQPCMTTATPACKKTYIRVPPRQALSGADKFTRALVGSALSPMYGLRASRQGLPGLGFAMDSATLALRALLRKKGGPSHADLSYAEIYRMLFWPVESTRYFEFELAWRFLANASIRRYLDVSSPRLFPLAFLARRGGVTAELINPDRKDLQVTTSLLRACGLEERCHTSNCLIEEAAFASASFDAITSLSVVEHIPQDQTAVEGIWKMLRPGGKLVLSMPCAAQAEEQYVDVDHFSLQAPDKNGFYFLQYVYDEALLQERFYSVLGTPAQFAVFGEKDPGSLQRGLLKKWSGAKYPKWKEPYLMAQEFQAYARPQDLPGEGVIVMEFVKP
jgi:SAM-dependent methyltransferase